ncbi:YesL family protein [Enterococcus sp. 5B3_DIV0040]|uniref:YesL family protein n=1 Tax=Enterococcus sp. 5B3_DIV0040 TaxID=1834182 RepID=UPI000B72B265|nr:hypothetical protein A5883_003602 [Enterococcus sp. 5B3_DIV0040]
MKSIFSLDNKIVKCCAFFYDLIFLNIVFVLSCLPLITIGVAKVSLYKTLWVLRKERSIPLLKTYIYYFLKFFKQGTILWLVEAMISCFCLLDLFLLREQTTLPFQIFKVFIYAMLILVMLTFLYAYPIISKLQMKMIKVMKLSFLFASLNFYWSFLFLIVILLILVIMYSSLFGFLLSLSIFGIFGFTLFTYVYQTIIEYIFERYYVNRLLF